MYGDNQIHAISQRKQLGKKKKKQPCSQRGIIFLKQNISKSANKSVVVTISQVLTVYLYYTKNILCKNEIFKKSKEKKKSE